MNGKTWDEVANEKAPYRVVDGIPEKLPAFGTVSYWLNSALVADLDDFDREILRDLFLERCIKTTEARRNGKL